MPVYLGKQDFKPSRLSGTAPILCTMLMSLPRPFMILRGWRFQGIILNPEPEIFHFL
jgi:hypothetical protein